MQIIQASVLEVPENLCPDGCVLTIGNFDGVHLGHRTLIRTAGRLAAESGVPLLILTFPPRQGVDAANLYTEAQKEELIGEIVPDALLLEVRFDTDLSTMPEDVFFHRILRERLRAKGIVVGQDFRYGYQAQGNVELLEQHCAACGIRFIALLAVTSTQADGTVLDISSTWIRSLLAEGSVPEANRLLGRPYYVAGTVLHGKGLGHTIGFPTINLKRDADMAELRHGVYVTRVTTSEGLYFGVTNVGLNPTVEHGHRIKIETMILDYSGDLYGQRIRVEFLSFLRPEHRFSGVEALQAQLAEDVRRAREWVIEHKQEGEN